jgi:hypothetical protein
MVAPASAAVVMRKTPDDDVAAVVKRNVSHEALGLAHMRGWLNGTALLSGDAGAPRKALKAKD